MKKRTDSNQKADAWSGISPEITYDDQGKLLILKIRLPSSCTNSVSGEDSDTELESREPASDQNPETSTSRNRNATTNTPDAKKKGGTKSLSRKKSKVPPRSGNARSTPPSPSKSPKNGQGKPGASPLKVKKGNVEQKQRDLELDSSSDAATTLLELICADPNLINSLLAQAEAIRDRAIGSDACVFPAENGKDQEVDYSLPFTSKFKSNSAQAAAAGGSTNRSIPNNLPFSRNPERKEFDNFASDPLENIDEEKELILSSSAQTRYSGPPPPTAIPPGYTTSFGFQSENLSRSCQCPPQYPCVCPPQELQCIILPPNIPNAQAIYEAQNLSQPLNLAQIPPRQDSHGQTPAFSPRTSPVGLEDQKTYDGRDKPIVDNAGPVPLSPSQARFSGSFQQGNSRSSRDRGSTESGRSKTNMVPLQQAMQSVEGSRPNDGRESPVTAGAGPIPLRFSGSSQQGNSRSSRDRGSTESGGSKTNMVPLQQARQSVERSKPNDRRESPVTEGAGPILVSPSQLNFTVLLQPKQGDDTSSEGSGSTESGESSDNTDPPATIGRRNTNDNTKSEPGTAFQNQDAVPIHKLSIDLAESQAQLDIPSNSLISPNSPEPFRKSTSASRPSESGNTPAESAGRLSGSASVQEECGCKVPCDCTLPSDTCKCSEIDRQCDVKDFQGSRWIEDPCLCSICECTLTNGSGVFILGSPGTSRFNASDQCEPSTSKGLCEYNTIGTGPQDECENEEDACEDASQYGWCEQVDEFCQTECKTIFSSYKKKRKAKKRKKEDEEYLCFAPTTPYLECETIYFRPTLIPPDANCPYPQLVYQYQPPRPNPSDCRNPRHHHR